MDIPTAIGADEARLLLEKTDALLPDEVRKILRYLKRSNEDLENKIRQLKSELGRVSRR